MKNLLMENLKNYQEKMELYQAEKKELSKDVTEFAKLEKMAKELEKHGGVIELPNIDEKKKELAKCEVNIKVCKSIIRRYESVYGFYFGEIQEGENQEVEKNNEDGVII